MNQHHEQQQERSRLKNQTKALYQATRRANPVVRRLEQSSDTARKRIAREEPGVREQQLQQIPWAPHQIPRTPHQIPWTPLERAADE